MGWINLDSVEPKKEIKTTIALEFDGVIVENDYPQMGKPNEEAISVLTELIENGYKLILNTKRYGPSLSEAIRYCNQNNILFYSVGNNELKENESNKLNATLYIETGCVGIPLKKGGNNKAVVDWIKIRDILVKWNMLKPKEISD